MLSIKTPTDKAFFYGAGASLILATAAVYYLEKKNVQKGTYASLAVAGVALCLMPILFKEKKKAQEPEQKSIKL